MNKLALAKCLHTYIYLKEQTHNIQNSTDLDRPGGKIINEKKSTATQDHLYFFVLFLFTNHTIMHDHGRVRFTYTPPLNLMLAIVIFCDNLMIPIFFILHRQFCKQFFLCDTNRRIIFLKTTLLDASISVFFI